MRVHTPRSLLIAAVFSSSVMGLAQSAHAAAPMKLRFHFHAGQQTRYLATIQYTGLDPHFQTIVSFTEKLPYTELVSKVNTDGSAQVVYTFSSATVTTGNKSTTNQVRHASISEHLSAQGAILSSMATGIQGIVNGDLTLDPTSVTTPVLPLSAVLTGSHWTANQHLSLGSFGGFDGALHYKLTGLAAANSQKGATIQVQGTLPLNAPKGNTQLLGTAATSNTIQFDVNDGAVISAHATIAIHLTPGSTSIGGQTNRLAGKLQLTVARQS